MFLIIFLVANLTFDCIPALVLLQLVKMYLLHLAVHLILQLPSLGKFYAIVLQLILLRYQLIILEMCFFILFYLLSCTLDSVQFYGLVSGLCSPNQFARYSATRIFYPSVGYFTSTSELACYQNCTKSSPSCE